MVCHVQLEKWGFAIAVCLTHCVLRNFPEEIYSTSASSGVHTNPRSQKEVASLNDRRIQERVKSTGEKHSQWVDRQFISKNY
jgi:hypothetical protein